MINLEHFSTSYVVARKKFLKTAESIELPVHSIGHDLRGPNNEVLAVDSVHVGDPEATRLIIMISGTHGVEGLTGSACQSAWLSQLQQTALPDDVAVLLIHAINPYGVAWHRRVNEDNVDLNRNFISHDGTGICNPHYAQVHDFMIPTAYDGEKRVATDLALAEIRSQLGEDVFQIATLGQSSHPDGFYYSGDKPVWSNLVLRKLLDIYALKRRIVSVIDFHTGLGAYGYGLVGIANDPGTPELQWARDWYGEGMTTFVEVGQLFGYPDYSAYTDGMLICGIRKILPDVSVISGGIEFGTYGPDEIQAAERSDAWLYAHGSNAPQETKETIRRELLEVYQPPKTDWQEMVLTRAGQVMRQTVNGIANLSSR